MAAITGFLAGNFHALVARRDSNGYPMGTLSTPDSPSTDTTYNPLKIHVASATVPEFERITAKFQHGQKIAGQRDLGVGDFGTFTIELASYSETFNSMIGGSAVDESTASGRNFTAPNSGNASLNQLFLTLCIGLQDDSGTNMFANIHWNNVQIAQVIPNADQSGGVNPASLTYTVTPSQSTRTVMGLLYSATSLAVQDDKDVCVIDINTYPVAFATYISSGVETAFAAVTWKPTGSDIDGSINTWTDEGVEDSANVSAFSTTTGVATATAADSGDRRVVTYPTQFVSV